MESVFPFSYFASIIHPKKQFELRKQVTWPQTILIFIFLMSVLGMPITLFYARVGSIPQDRFFNQQPTLFTTELVQQLQPLAIEQGTLQEARTMILAQNDQAMIGVNIPQAEMNGKDVVSFNQTKWIVKSGEKWFENRYAPSFQLTTVNNPKELVTFFETQFYQSNRLAIILSYSLSFFLLLGVLFLFLFLGGAIFLWLSKNSQFSDIHTYHQALNVILLSYTFPIMVGSLYSMVAFNVLTLIGLPLVGGAGMLLILYAKTKFKETKEGDERV